jgi:hypothetical protein
MNTSFLSLKKLFAVLFLVFICSQVKSQDTLSVMYYNLLNYSPASSDNIKYLKQITSYIKPDVFVVNEISDDTSASSIVSDVLNINGITHYKRAIFTSGPDTDNMLFYNSDKLTLVLQDTITTALRYINRYRLFANNSINILSDSVFMDFYGGHLKASSGTTNELARYEEVKLLKNYIESNTDSKNSFFGGDMNFYGSLEPALKLLLDSGAFRMVDPIDSIGDWHDNPSYANIHTQSTRARQFGGGATGGLDDRFDFIFTTQDLSLGENFLKYIPGTYKAFGNDGNHLNDSLTALPLNPTIPDSITYALYGQSDHLPVIMKLALGDFTSYNEFSLTDFDFEISPNPSEGFVTISFKTKTNSDFQIKVTDYSGRVVYSISEKQQSGLFSKQIYFKQKGLYFFSISENGITRTKKIIFQ